MVTGGGGAGFFFELMMWLGGEVLFCEGGGGRGSRDRFSRRDWFESIES